MRRHFRGCRYSVAYTDPSRPDWDRRQFEDFNNKNKAMRFAQKKVKEGCTEVFIDMFDEDDDLIDYMNVSSADNRG